jgi:hypothetical protein
MWMEADSNILCKLRRNPLKRPNRKIPLWLQRAISYIFTPEPSWYAWRNFHLEVINKEKKRARPRVVLEIDYQGEVVKACSTEGIYLSIKHPIFSQYLEPQHFVLLDQQEILNVT